MVGFNLSPDLQVSQIRNRVWLDFHLTSKVLQPAKKAENGEPRKFKDQMSHPSKLHPADPPTRHPPPCGLRQASGEPRRAHDLGPRQRGAARRSRADQRHEPLPRRGARRGSARLRARRGGGGGVSRVLVPLLQTPWTNVPLGGLMFIYPLPKRVYPLSGMETREAKGYEQGICTSTLSSFLQETGVGGDRSRLKEEVRHIGESRAESLAALIILAQLMLIDGPAACFL